MRTADPDRRAAAHQALLQPAHQDPTVAVDVWSRAALENGHKLLTLTAPTDPYARTGHGVLSPHQLHPSSTPARLLQAALAEGFTGLSVYHNDRPHVLAPPYGTKAERTAITEWLAAPVHASDVAMREDTLRFVLAGGMTEAQFDAAWAVLAALDTKERAALGKRTLSSCVAGNLYLFAARKPAR